MQTRDKIQEAFDILTAELRVSRTARQGHLARAHRLLESALGDYFESEEDIATLIEVNEICHPDELVGELNPPAPRV
jgi:hypothetical protein